MRNRLYGALVLAGTVAMVGLTSPVFAQGYGPGGGMQGGYGPGGGMMGGYGYGAYGPVHLIFWAVILIVVIVGIVWVVRSVGAPGAHHMPLKRSAGLDVLEERYGRGEIDRDEYLQKKKDIGG